VRALLAEPGSAAALAARLGAPRQRVNYHLRELEEAGIVELVEERRKGNCVERVLRAAAGGFLLDPEALGVAPLGGAELQDRFSATALIAAAARTVRDVAAQRDGAAAARKRLATLAVEARVRLASPSGFAAFAADLAEAVAGVAARHHDAAAPGGREIRLLVGAHPAPPAGARQGRER